jgi:uncharacterized protein DUF3179
MRKVFVVGVIGLILFELANVYFIMPMPGSQRMRSVDVAHFLYTWRWWLRAAFGILVLMGAPAAWRTSGRSKWLVPASLVVAAAVTYAANFRMAADQMFRQPTRLVMQPVARNAVAKDRLVVGIDVNGDARAYPLRFIGYHHQVRDNVGGEEVLVSYCTVCRTGRVFSPVVDGKVETFRVRGPDDRNLVASGQRRGHRRQPQGNDARRDSESPSHAE